MKSSDTICVHPLRDQPNEFGAVTGGVYPSTAYNYLDGGELKYPGFYSTNNQKRLGQIIATLEQADWGMVFSSGMAAISTAILSFVKAGDHVIFSRDLYGGTLKFAIDELPKRGIECSFTNDFSGNFQSLVRSNTKVLYTETPSNPLLNIVSLEDVVKVAKKNNLITIIDNTFASPVNQLPILLGIDISVHSGTKYLGGHNDLPYGALVCKHEQYKEAIANTAKMYGGSLTPYECYLAERSLKTLSIRVQKQNENALQLAQYLSNHKAIEKVYYPGLPSHSQYEIAKKQMKGFGGMVSFELKTNLEGINSFQKKLQLISPALSLGGVESLICSPVFTSHRYLSAAERQAIGINDNLLRMSVGIENAEDLIADIEQAISVMYL